MSTASPRQSERRYLWTLASWLFLALCLFALIHLFAPVCNSAGASAGGSAGTLSSAPPGADPATVAAAELAAATERRKAAEVRSLAKVRLQRLRHSADDVIALTRQFEREHDEWAALATGLLSDERGKRLAADPDAVQAFRSLSQASRPLRGLSEQVRQNVATLMAPLDAALKDDDSAYSPSETLAVQLEEEMKRALAAIDEYQRPRRQLEGLVLATAARSGADTLATVIQRLEAANARSQASAIAVAQQQATNEVREQVAEAEGTKVREIGKSHAERVKAEEDAEQARIDAEALRTRQSGERDRLLKLANDSAVQARFAPFLSAGRRYPARYEGSVRWLERKPWGRTPPRPVSLRELKTGGVLDSLQNFVVAAASSKSKTGAQNDRPHWPMPTTQAEWTAAEAEFNLFNELVPVWVELRVLPSE